MKCSAVYGSVCKGGGIERERQREKEREKKREREKEKKIDRERERKMEREIAIERD